MHCSKLGGRVYLQGFPKAFLLVIFGNIKNVDKNCQPYHSPIGCKMVYYFDRAFLVPKYVFSWVLHMAVSDHKYEYLSCN